MAEKTDYIDDLIKAREEERLRDKELEAGDEEVKIIFLSKNITLPQVKEICNKYLYLPDDNIIDYLLAVCMSNFSEGKRLWTWLIGEPSTGKTELLRHLLSDVSLFKDSITDKTLYSGFGGKGRDLSLFKRLNGKMFFIKDFTKMLSGRPDTLTGIVGQLRCAADGFFDASTGADDKDYRYITIFTLIAAVVPSIDDHYSIRDELGERFLSWRIKNIDRKKLLNKVKENRDRKTEMEKDLDLYFSAFIKKYRALDKLPLLDEDIAAKIGELADIGTWARTHVKRVGRDREIRRAPGREAPPRLYEQLMRLAQMLALVRDKKEVSMDEYNICLKVTLNTMLPERIAVIELLLKIQKENSLLDEKDYKVCLNTSDIGLRLNYPTNTVRFILDDLFLLKILERTGSSEYAWSLIPEFSERWANLGLL